MKIENEAGVPQLLTVNARGQLSMTTDLRPPHECDCGRRFFSADRVRDCMNTGHKDKPL